MSREKFYNHSKVERICNRWQVDCEGTDYYHPYWNREVRHSLRMAETKADMLRVLKYCTFNEQILWILVAYEQLKWDEIGLWFHMEHWEAERRWRQLVHQIVLDLNREVEPRKKKEREPIPLYRCADTDPF